MAGMTGGSRPPAQPIRRRPRRKRQATPALPEIDGTFRIVTDGQILANNTDEGPQAGAGGQVLEWRVTKRTPGRADGAGEARP